MNAYRLFAPVPCLLVCAFALAEDQPVPFAPTPAPAPAAAEAAATPEGAPAPASGEAGTVAFTAPQREAPAPDKRERWFSGSLIVGVGYDSNVLLEDSDTPSATEESSLALSADARLRLHAVERDDARLTFIGSAGVDQYPSVSDARQLRGGLGMAAGGRWGAVDPGLVTGLTKVVVDGDLAANAWNIDPYLSITWKGQVSVIGAQSLYIDYPQDDTLTGTLYAVYYRHWLLLDEQVVHRRIEVGLRYGRNTADAATASYNVLTPSLAGLWRFGDKPENGTQDVALRLSWERRSYDAGTADDGEEQRLLQLAATYDYWLSRYVSVGAQAAHAKRTSTVDLRDYDRTAAGVRAGVFW